MIVRILSSALAVSLLIVAWGFAAAESDKESVRKVEIEMNLSSGDTIMTVQDIEFELGTHQYPGTLVRDLDLQGLVQYLEDSLDACSKAEAYPTKDGVLHIHMWQRTPVLRVHHPQQPDFFLDDQGVRMDLTDFRTPHVPIMHAENAFEANVALEFVNATKNDPFWNALIDQFSMNDRGELTLHPRLEGHSIVLGKADRVDEKKRNLVAFYRAQIHRGNLRNFQQIDLSYRDQVIAKRTS